MPLDYFTDREIFEAVTLSIWLRGWNNGRFSKKSLGGDKVTASKMGGFASKTGFLLRWRIVRYAYAASSGSFLMMMTGQSGENAASSGQNSSLMPTTLFNLA